MNLCQSCKYQEVPNTANSAVKSFILIEECDTCRAQREAQYQQSAAVKPYVEADIQAIKQSLRTAFTGELGVLGSVYSMVSDYLEYRDWRGLKEIVTALFEEGSAPLGAIMKFSAVLKNYGIDLDNIPEGV